jgi:hypothetical protein
VQDAAAWEIVTVSPAIVTAPVREVAVVFAAIVNVVVLLLEPLDGETVIQAALGEAVHAHPLAVVTVELAVPPPLPTEALVGDTP